MVETRLRSEADARPWLGSMKAVAAVATSPSLASSSSSTDGTVTPSGTKGKGKGRKGKGKGKSKGGKSATPTSPKGGGSRAPSPKGSPRGHIPDANPRFPLTSGSPSLKVAEVKSQGPPPSPGKGGGPARTVGVGQGGVLPVPAGQEAVHACLLALRVLAQGPSGRGRAASTGQFQTRWSGSAESVG